MIGYGVGCFNSIKIKLKLWFSAQGTQSVISILIFMVLYQGDIFSNDCKRTKHFNKLFSHLSNNMYIENLNLDFYEIILKTKINIYDVNFEVQFYWMIKLKLFRKSAQCSNILFHNGIYRLHVYSSVNKCFANTILFQKHAFIWQSVHLLFI